MRSAAEATGFATTPQDAKPFVQASRPADPRYLPISSTIPVNPPCRPVAAVDPATQKTDLFGFPVAAAEPVRQGPCKQLADFKAIEKNLVAKQTSNDAAGAQAQALGKKLPPPAPAKLPPTN